LGFGGAHRFAVRGSRGSSERRLPDIIRRTNAHNHWENAWAKFGAPVDRLRPAIRRGSLALGAEVRQEVLPLLSGDLRPEMVEALTRVKSSFKTGCITFRQRDRQPQRPPAYVAEVMAPPITSSSPPRSACASPIRESIK
jgi:putative hydrolase of the HAD superfamily